MNPIYRILGDNINTGLLEPLENSGNIPIWTQAFQDNTEIWNKILDKTKPVFLVFPRGSQTLFMIGFKL